MRDVQLPGIVSVVRDRQPLIQGHHVSVDGQDCLRVGFYPRHPILSQIVDYASK